MTLPADWFHLLWLTLAAFGVGLGWSIGCALVRKVIG